MERSTPKTIRRDLYLTVFSVLVALSASSQLHPQHGSWPISKVPGPIPKVGDSIAPRHDSVLCLVNSAQLDPCYVAVDNGIEFKVAYRVAEGFRVTDVRTNDPHFVSPEGLKVGDVITIRKRQDLILAGYFEVYANSGKTWVPIVGSLDKVFVEGADRKEAQVPINQLRFDGREIHLRIDGFRQWAGVD